VERFRQDGAAVSNVMAYLGYIPFRSVDPEGQAAFIDEHFDDLLKFATTPSIRVRALEWFLDRSDAPEIYRGVMNDRASGTSNPGSG
jgi:hypothetical protein